MSLIKDFFSENFFRKKTNTSSGKPRIEFIDLAKGLCIILVVLLHNGLTLEFPLIKAIRMPLYFILSGLFFSDYGSFFTFLIKKTNRLIIPLVFFLLIGFLFSVLFSSNFSELLTNPFYANFPLWFLLCLFWVNLFYYLIHSTIKNDLLKYIIVLCFGLIGVFLSQKEIDLPLYFSSAFSATPFFFVGILLRKLPLLYKSEHDKAFLVLGLALLISTLAYCIFISNPGIHFTINKFRGGYIENLIISILGVVGLLLVCKSVQWLPIISYLGRYSVMILGLHIVFRNFAYLPIYKLTKHEFSQFEVFALSMFLCWISIPFLKRYLPKFCAQKDLIRPKSK